MKEEIELNVPNEMPAEWKLSERGKAAIAYANKMHKTTSGFYSSVPLICRGKSCRYKERCPLIELDLYPEGEVCALEADDAKTMFEEYCKEFGIDPNDNSKSSLVDKTLIEELVATRIGIKRANNCIAIDGDFIQQISVGVDGRGNVITRPEIHQAIKYYDQMVKRRDTLYKQLVATRRDKAEMKQQETSNETMVSDIVKKAIAEGIVANTLYPQLIDINNININKNREEEE
jgi:hypothetical protein